MKCRCTYCCTPPYKKSPDCSLPKPFHLTIYKNSVPTSQRTQVFIIKTIWLILFQEIIYIYYENHTKLTQVNTRDKMQFNINYNRCYIVTNGLKIGWRGMSSHGHSNSCVKQSSSHKDFFCSTAAVYTCMCL